PGLVETDELPDTHAFIGPLLWSYPARLPEWWDRAMSSSKPRVFVTLGSSGPAALLPNVVDALRAEDVTVLVATAGRASVKPDPSVFAADYLPADRACAAADIVICNGGSPMVYAALAAGRPVLGIPSNMDQHMMIEAAARAGCAIGLRSEQASAAQLQRAFRSLLGNEAAAQRAREWQKAITSFATSAIFARILERALPVAALETVSG
ncbi:MAG TPA: nucleotide disphospho-sugar-binding domain-containing protein, partial [Planctomycetota bacterium]|nr:nucleotide disphospho-sugar-binding domain-containing protein [Planctomycetota bacterium]